MVKKFAHLIWIYVHSTKMISIIYLLYIHNIHVQSICEGINFDYYIFILIDHVMLKDENYTLILFMHSSF